MGYYNPFSSIIDLKSIYKMFAFYSILIANKKLFFSLTHFHQRIVPAQQYINRYIRSFEMLNSFDSKIIFSQTCIDRLSVCGYKHILYH